MITASQSNTRLAQQLGAVAVQNQQTGLDVVTHLAHRWWSVPSRIWHVPDAALSEPQCKTPTSRLALTSTQGRI